MGFYWPNFSLVFLIHLFLYVGVYCIQIYCDQRKRLPKEKSSAPTGLVWDNNMVAVSVFWDADLADLTSCNKALKLGAVKVMRERPWEQGYSSCHAKT